MVHYLKEIIGWFSKLLFVHNVCECEAFDENSTEELLNTNGKYKKVILELLQKADVDIDDIELIEFNQARSEKTGKGCQSSRMSILLSILSTNFIMNKMKRLMSLPLTCMMMNLPALSDCSIS